MIKHIVLFKLKDFASRMEKENWMQEIKENLENLIHTIPQLKKIHVGLNINPSEQWDMALETEFANMNDLNSYANHPAHVAIVEKLIAPVKAERACVDFTY